MRTLVLLLLLTLGGSAAAHAHLYSSSPERRSMIEVLPETVELEFSEGIELNFSLFKVYRLEADALLDEGGEPDANEWRRLNGLAGALMNEVLTLRDDDEARADTGLVTERRVSDTVTLGLKEGLEPGVYVVMWRVLSVDTHTTQGFFTFLVRD